MDYQAIVSHCHRGLARRKDKDSNHERTLIDTNDGGTKWIVADERANYTISGIEPFMNGSMQSYSSGFFTIIRVGNSNPLRMWI